MSLLWVCIKKKTGEIPKAIATKDTSAQADWSSLKESEDPSSLPFLFQASFKTIGWCHPKPHQGQPSLPSWFDSPPIISTDKLRAVLYWPARTSLIQSNWHIMIKYHFRFKLWIVILIFFSGNVYLCLPHHCILLLQDLPGFHRITVEKFCCKINYISNHRHYLGCGSVTQHLPGKYKYLSLIKNHKYMDILKVSQIDIYK